MSRQIIIIAGMGFSGSGAVCDFLKEFPNIGSIDCEFRLIKDPGGLKDLVWNCTQGWNFARADIALKRFQKTVKFLSLRKNRLLGRHGLDYEKYFNNKFMEITRSFIEELVSEKWPGKSFAHHYDINFFDRFMIFVKKRLKIYNHIINGIYLSPDMLKKIVRAYLNDLLDAASSGKQQDFFMLDQAVDPVDIPSLDTYFTNWKVIVVDRDPRDNYFDGDKVSWIPRDIEAYAFWYKSQRDNLALVSNNKNVKVIRFEEFVLNHEKEKMHLLKFLQLDEKKHLLKKKYFDPDVSSRNVGQWRDKDENIGREIQNILSSYCTK